MLTYMFLSEKMCEQVQANDKTIKRCTNGMPKYENKLWVIPASSFYTTVLYSSVKVLH